MATPTAEPGTMGRMTHWRWRTATTIPMALLSAGLLLVGPAQAAETAAGDKAAVFGAPALERPHLLDGMFASSEQPARRWGQGDKAYVGMLAAHDVETKLCDPDVQSQSGYFKIKGSKDTNYFYWFFESRSDPVTDPFIVWLTGGPGCSSILALLTENGPCFVTANGTATANNPHSWTSRANVIWIDQPAGAGFSYAGKGDPVVDTEEEVAEDLYQFMQSFFEANSRFAANPFYVFGESYGGHFVPAFCHHIYTANLQLAANAGGEQQQQQQQQIQINLKGLGIGNGLVDPEVQYQYYSQYGQRNAYNIPLFSNETAHKIARAVPRCVSLIHSCQNAGRAACALARVFCSSRIVDYFPVQERNIYDIRKRCEHPPLCYDFDPIAAWLARPDVRQALHVVPESGAWAACSDAVLVQFVPDMMRSYHQLLVPLLENGVKALIFAGDADFICNTLGIEAWTQELDWQGQEGYRATAKRIWRTTAGESAGAIKSHGGLTYLDFFESGHMVPLDQPARALEMLNAFTGTDPQAVQAWESSINGVGAIDPAMAATTTAAAAAAPANDDDNKKSRKESRALRGQRGALERREAETAVVQEQEIEAVPCM